MGSQVDHPLDEVRLEAQERVSGRLVSVFVPLTPLFWVVNVSVVKLADWRSLSVAVAANMLLPQLKSVSLRRNVVISDFEPVYLLGQRRNK